MSHESKLSAEAIADELLQDGRGPGMAYARALGRISGLTGLHPGVSAEQRLRQIALICDAIDVVDQRSSSGGGTA